MLMIHRRVLGLGVVGMLAAACADPLRPPDEGYPARLVISASVAGTPIGTLVATVSAADIPVTIVKNLTVRDGTASGTLVIPPGAARTIRVTALDDDGRVSHEGSATVDVRYGQNPTVTIPMLPRAGTVPIDVQVGSVTISVSPVSATLQVGSALQLVATIATLDNEHMDGSPAWATTAPALVSVSRHGLITGLREGTAQVIATFGGVAAIATVEVASGDTP